jgi:hypothetical protein
MEEILYNNVFLVKITKIVKRKKTSLLQYAEIPNIRALIAVVTAVYIKQEI